MCTTKLCFFCLLCVPTQAFNILVDFYSCFPNCADKYCLYGSATITGIEKLKSDPCLFFSPWVIEVSILFSPLETDLYVRLDLVHLVVLTMMNHGRPWILVFRFCAQFLFCTTSLYIWADLRSCAETAPASGCVRECPPHHPGAVGEDASDGAEVERHQSGREPHNKDLEERSWKGKGGMFTYFLSSTYYFLCQIRLRVNGDVEPAVRRDQVAGKEHENYAANIFKRV